MRANITINDRGAIRASNGGGPPRGGLKATRLNQKFTITLGETPTVYALLTLIRTLRAIDSSMAIIGSRDFDGTGYTRDTVCFPLARLALQRLEDENPGLFKSDIQTVTPNCLTLDMLPDGPLRLARMQLVANDVPASLNKVYDAQIKNLALVGQTLSMKLSFIAVPKNLIWPEPPPIATQPIANCLRHPMNLWFEIIYELALIARQRIHHFGTLRMPSGQKQYFHRIIYPITAQSLKAHNHRILSAAALPNMPDAIIV